MVALQVKGVVIGLALGELGYRIEAGWEEVGVNLYEKGVEMECELEIMRRLSFDCRWF